MNISERIDIQGKAQRPESLDTEEIKMTDEHTQEAPMLKNIGFIGLGYSLLDINPYYLGASSGTKHPVFSVGADEKSHLIPDGTASIPDGTFYKPDNWGESLSQSEFLYNAYDFQSTFSRQASANIGIPGLFSFSLSKSYQSFKKEVGQTENFQTYTEATYHGYVVEIEDESSTTRLPLDQSFKAEVAKLPTSFEIKKSDSEKSNELNELNKLKLYDFIDKFGTHYAKSIAFGGRVSQSITLTKEAYTELTRKGINIGMGAQGTFEEVTVGGSGGLDEKQQQEFNQITKSGQKAALYIGGSQNEDISQFLASTKESPAPIDIQLEPLSKLLSADYFPDDANIQLKQQALATAIDSYIIQYGEANEPFSENKWVVYSPNGVKYDTGDRPCVAILQDGTVIDIHNGGGNNNLYYRIGHISNNILSWIGEHGTKYDTGDNPCVTALENSTLVEIHNGGGNNNLYYRIGTVQANTIQWVGNHGVKYDTGDNPSVAALNHDTIIEVHNGGGNNNLYYRIGKVGQSSIEWQGSNGIKFDTGDNPSVAVLNNDTVVVVYNGGDNNNLYYSIGKYKNDQLTWVKDQVGVKYGTGNQPAITAVGRETLLQINNGGGNNNLYYLVGKVISDRLTWVGSKGNYYDTGNNPCVASMSDGTTLDIHNGGGNNNLYYNLAILA
ncbi:MAC/perforin domain-containing protein [Pseudoalteromonas umbrosa]|uniref:MAC/perforin domain-containing protein n=1 Tax=Pseudoalteromonas umbrosa TaxID=3048489 RepID=UPI0024C38DDB|nr:MAC/perforin domain-containing protein [Pseudoalteromonas sp. B95]MDK1286264.1 MAC/perforin domain-containing protein [Pseudoalteromonas sp. B95]